MRNLLFKVEEVINEPENLDVWVVFQTEKELEKYHSLYNLLWKVSFDASKAVKNYEVKHSVIYQLLLREDDTGKVVLA